MSLALRHTFLTLVLVPDVAPPPLPAGRTTSATKRRGKDRSTLARTDLARSRTRCSESRPTSVICWSRKRSRRSRRARTRRCRTSAAATRSSLRRSRRPLLRLAVSPACPSTDTTLSLGLQQVLHRLLLPPRRSSQSSGPTRSQHRYVFPRLGVVHAIYLHPAHLRLPGCHSGRARRAGSKSQRAHQSALVPLSCSASLCRERY